MEQSGLTEVAQRQMQLVEQSAGLAGSQEMYAPPFAHSAVCAAIAWQSDSVVPGLLPWTGQPPMLPAPLTV